MNPSPSSPQPEPSSDAARLLRIVRELAHELRPRAGEVDHLSLDHGLERDFGLDSLARVELLVRVDRELGVRLAEAAFAEAETPRDLLRLMGSKALAEIFIPDEATIQAEAAIGEEAGIEHPPRSFRQSLAFPVKTWTQPL